MKLTPQAIEEAKRHPNSHVYVIDGDFQPHEAVPPERIVGAWKVDSTGTIIGDFIPNPNYRKSN
jgi:hypothetical protein